MEGNGAESPKTLSMKSRYLDTVQHDHSNTLAALDIGVGADVFVILALKQTFLFKGVSAKGQPRS